MLRRHRTDQRQFTNRHFEACAIRLPVLAKLLLLAAVLFALATAVASSQDIPQLIQRGLALLRAAGPVTFFLAMAVLPAAGAPLSFFGLTAGSVFGPQLGIGIVVLVSMVAIGVNIALGFVLARYALGPPISYLCRKLGYQLPQVRAGDATDLIVLLRVTPGVPFVVQNYLLGLSGVPFPKYLLVSCLVAFPLNAAIILFGEALLQGRGRAAVLGFLAILAVLAALQLVRRRYGTRASASLEKSSI